MISDDTIVSEANVAYVAAKFAPYTELKFIESTGTQYIDTGYKPNNNTKLEIVFWSNKSDAQSIASVDHGWRAETFGIWGTALGFGTDVNTHNDESGVARYNHDYKIDARLSQEGFYKNGVLCETFSDYTFDLNYNLPLFALNRNGTILEFSKAKLYSCKLYENNILVRDFVPVMTRYGDVGLFDLIEYKFYGNAGSGTFIAGPEAKLPDEYTEVEYLEGNGQTPAKGPYISTDIKASGNAICFCDYQYVSLGNAVGPAIFGTRDANSQTANNMYTFMYRINDSNPSSGQYRFDYNRGNNKHNTGPLSTDRKQITIYNNELRYEDCSTITNTYANFQSSLNLSLFGLNTAGSTSNVAHARIYSFEYYDDGINRFFVPCKKNDGTFGLFELYTKVFYGNASNKTGVTDFTGGEKFSSNRLISFYEGTSIPANLRTVSRYFGITNVNDGPNASKPLSVYDLNYSLQKLDFNKRYIFKQYLENNETNYIDTGILANETTKAQIVCIFSSFTGAAVFGNMQEGDSNDWRLFNYSDGHFYFDLQSGRIIGGSWTAGQKYYIEVGNFYIKNFKTSEFIAQGNPVSTYTSSSPICLYLQGGNLPKTKVYSFKVWNNGTLVRDYIPAIDLEASSQNQQSGLYDRVTKTFTFGTGGFVTGP